MKKKKIKGHALDSKKNLRGQSLDGKKKIRGQFSGNKKGTAPGNTRSLFFITQMPEIHRLSVIYYQTILD